MTAPKRGGYSGAVGATPPVPEMIPEMIYVRRRDLGALLVAARHLVRLETATARNSHTYPGRRRGAAFHADWQEADPEHFKAVRSLDAARSRIAYSIARR